MFSFLKDLNGPRLVSCVRNCKDNTHAYFEELAF